MTPAVVPSKDRVRDVAGERLLHAQLGVDAGLAAFALSRCEDGPVRDWEDRDFLVDGCEEAADGLNYLTWELQRLTERGQGGERYQAAAMALRAFSDAYQAIQWARRAE